DFHVIPSDKQHKSRYEKVRVRKCRPVGVAGFQSFNFIFQVVPKKSGYPGMWMRIDKFLKFWEGMLSVGGKRCRCPGSEKHMEVSKMIVIAIGIEVTCAIKRCGPLQCLLYKGVTVFKMVCRRYHVAVSSIRGFVCGRDR